MRLAESDLFLQKMTIKIENPLESNLSSIQEDFSLSAFPLFTGTFFVALSLVIAFSASFGCDSKSPAPYWNSGLPLRKFNRIYSLHIANTCCFPFCLVRLVFCFASEARRSVFSMVSFIL